MILPLAVACGSSGASSGGSAGGASGGPSEGGSCSRAGEQTGMENGTLECADTASGLVWQRMSAPVAPSGGTPADTVVAGATKAADTMGGGDQPPAQQQRVARVGEQCDRDGAITFGDGMMTVCDGTTVRYAMAADVPPVPAGGYTERPDWYPTLGDMFGPLVDVCPDGGPVRFTHTVVDPAKVTRSMPAGMMITDHVTPIDHMYIGISALDLPEDQRAAAAATLTAPADGTVIEVGSLGSPTSHRIVIAHGCGVVSVYMVVNQLTGVLAPYAADVESKGYVPLSLPVQAGDELGTQTSNMIDFNIFDSSTWLTGFANPFSYANGEAWKPYTADPFPFFVNGAGDAIEASSQRTIGPRWGVIDRDVIGTAAGSWFIDGTMGYQGVSVETAAAATSGLPGGQIAGKNVYAWGHLSLSPQPVDETAWIFSTGWWADPAGDPKQVMLDLSAGLPAPDELSAADGAVLYPLVQASLTQPPGYERSTMNSPDGIGYTVVAGGPVGWALIQVVGETTLEVELSTDPAVKPTGFTAAKRTYHR